MIWFSSDWHLGETRFDIMSRPFLSTEEMYETLLINHNKLVLPSDEFILNGDIIYQNADDGWLDRIAKFNGKKTLIRGNQDRKFSDADLALYFDTIIPEGDGIEIEVEGIPCWVTHYPTRARADKFCLIGHIHGAFKVQLNMLNLSVDVHHFRPINGPKVKFYYDAICNFYDKDVWVAYDAFNANFLGERGKQSRYFEE